MSPVSRSFSTRLATAAGALLLMSATAQAQDLVVDGSLCVGFDCPANPAFGFDTIRLQENNLRIHFDDTSTAAAFPPNDWRIYANDSANGGSSYFGVEDATAGRFVFRVFAGARSNALTVDSQGDVGLGTTTPATDIDIRTGDTPTVRLQQDGSAGFTPQTWDVAGNEAGFFIRDATSGSTLPFRILPGADSQSLVIDGNNDVGIGAGTNPTASLHVARSDGTTQLLVEDTGGSGPQQLVKLENNGAVQWVMENTNNSAVWMLSSGNSLLVVPSTNTADAVFDLSNTGNLTIDGTLTELSDKHAKMAIEPVDPDAILAKVTTLPIAEWTYTHDAEAGTRHIGPMAQDFYAAFGTGADERGISTLDSTGVALAAIQALSAQNAALRARLDALEAQLSE